MRFAARPFIAAFAAALSVTAPAAASPITVISAGVYFWATLPGVNDPYESASGGARTWHEDVELSFRMARTTRIELPPGGPLEFGRSIYEFEGGVADFGGIQMRVKTMKGWLTEYGQELLDDPGGWLPNGHFDMEFGPGIIPQYLIEKWGLAPHAHVIRAVGDFWIEDVTPLTDQTDYPYESRRGDTDDGGHIVLYIAPEPATTVLLMLGGLVLALRRSRWPLNHPRSPGIERR